MWFVIDKKLSPKINTLKSKNINEIIKNELKHRFDFEKDPLIRFTLLNQTETTLIINCHHAICDGLSLMYLFKDIMKILSGKDIKIEQKMPVFLEPENIPQRLGNPISRFFISLINKKWGKKPIRFSNQFHQEMHTKFWKEYKLQIIPLNSQRKKQQILFRNANKIMFQLIQDWLLPSYMRRNNCLSKKTIQAKL